MSSSFLINMGKRNTILVSISIVLLSLYMTGFYLYYIYKYDDLFSGSYKLKVSTTIEVVKFIAFSILLFFIYKGRDWARKILIVLLIFFLYKTTEAIGSVLILFDDFVRFNITNLSFTIVIYSSALYHFIFSKSFIFFTEHQNST